MPSYKPPTFQERTALAAKAKKAALDRFNDRVLVDDKISTAQRDARARRATLEAEKREDKRVEWQRVKAERKARANERQELESALPVPTSTELEAARQARYSPRKSKAK